MKTLMPSSSLMCCLPACLRVLQAFERDKRGSLSPLRYPGKLACDLVGQRIFISDSNNHRIVITGLDGTYIDQVGAAGQGRLHSQHVCGMYVCGQQARGGNLFSPSWWSTPPLLPHLHFRSDVVCPPIDPR